MLHSRSKPKQLQNQTLLKKIKNQSSNEVNRETQRKTQGKQHIRTEV